ncbi:MAG: SufD family Fe-S cluster assembly protein [Clostridia bacterium]|nr:SufD family Fe-S cluster assembly protein [Clostridia bacterium]
MDAIQMELLKEVADLDALPVGAYNIRADGKSIGRNSTAHIIITPKEDKPGIDIRVLAGTKKESMHIPVIMQESGLKDMVYNDFYVEENCDVTIIAGCGIHNCGTGESRHDGIHTFYIGKNSTVRYVEKHYGEGNGRGKQVMNPTTVIHLGKNASMTMETSQIAGIDDTERSTSADLEDGASLVVREKILTTGDQKADTVFNVDLNGKGSSADVVSRSVARDQSRQHLVARVNGNSECTGHTECDSIIIDSGRVLAQPELEANCVDASLVHEAAIGKIAGEQLIKLMTLGLTEHEAEEQIINGFLR